MVRANVKFIMKAKRDVAKSILKDRKPSVINPRITKRINELREYRVKPIKLLLTSGGSLLVEFPSRTDRSETSIFGKHREVFMTTLVQGFGRRDTSFTQKQAQSIARRLKVKAEVL